MSEVTPEAIEAGLVAALTKHATLKIATSGGPVSPWVAGCYYAEVNAFTLQAILETHGKSFKNITANPKVALIISGPLPFELYAQAEATVRVLEGDELKKAHDALRKKNPSMEPLFALPVTTVSFDVSRWFVSDIPNGWLPAKELNAR